MDNYKSIKLPNEIWHLIEEFIGVLTEDDVKIIIEKNDLDKEVADYYDALSNLFWRI